MAWSRRIFLFLLVNFLVVLTISTLLSVLGIRPYLQRTGLDIPSLAIFCLIWGMGGAFISLALSRVIAKWSMGVQIIDPASGDFESRRILETVYRLAREAGLSTMPEVGIYDSPEVNAFATGPTKSRALVAISSGLLSRMNEDETEGVIGHELTHISNGDMVTMTLLQGVVNAFVMFLSRLLAYAVATAAGGNRDRDEGQGFSYGIYYLTSFLFEIVFMILGSMVVAWFSRFREFRADRGGAQIAGRERMIGALESLKRTYEVVDPQAATPAVQALKINTHPGSFLKLFATHPPLDERIARLRNG